MRNTILTLHLIRGASFHSRIVSPERLGRALKTPSSCQSVMKNKSGTSAVALARERTKAASKQTPIFYKNHKKTALSAGIENKRERKKIIIIIWINKICCLHRNTLRWKVDRAQRQLEDNHQWSLIHGNVRVVILPKWENWTPSHRFELFEVCL